MFHLNYICFIFLKFVCWTSGSELQLVHIFFEVTEAHEGRALVREVAADSGRVAAGTRVEQHAELVVVDAVGFAADLAQVFLQI